jgi:hypothetical protein
MHAMSCYSLGRLFNASCWPIIHGGKKVKWPSIFELTQQHTNNWEVNIIILQCIVFLVVDVSPFGYGQIYNFFFDDKQYDVIIGNFP